MQLAEWVYEGIVVVAAVSSYERRPRSLMRADHWASRWHRAQFCRCRLDDFGRGRCCGVIGTPKVKAALSVQVTVPAWPWFRRHPLKWQSTRSTTLTVPAAAKDSTTPIVPAAAKAKKKSK
jgi:hypothetical protein